MVYNPYELIYMSRTGDMIAVQALFSQYRRYIAALIMASIGSNPSLQIYREDIRQETAIAFLEALESFRNDLDNGFTTFLGVVVKRKIWNILRGYHSQNRVQMHTTLTLDTLVNEDESFCDLFPQKDPMCEPSFYYAYRMAQERLRDCIAGLNDAEYEIYQRMYRQENYETAARELGCSKRSYDGKVQRLRRKIRDAVGN